MKQLRKIEKTYQFILLNTNPKIDINSQWPFDKGSERMRECCVPVSLRENPMCAQKRECCVSGASERQPVFTD